MPPSQERESTNLMAAGAGRGNRSGARRMTAARRAGHTRPQSPWPEPKTCCDRRLPLSGRPVAAERMVLQRFSNGFPMLRHDFRASNALRS